MSELGQHGAGAIAIALGMIRRARRLARQRSRQ
jgi:hypothetical protein